VPGVGPGRDRADGRDPAADRLDVYTEAGFQGSSSFVVRPDLDLDQDWERSAIRAFVCSAFATTHELAGQPNTPTRLSWTSSLVARSRWSPWRRCGRERWSFAIAGQSGCPGSRHGSSRTPGRPGISRPTGRQASSSAGPADPSTAPSGSRSFTSWLLEAKPQDQHLLDFGRALQRPADQATTFWVSSLAGSGPVPDSLRELASALGYERHDFGNKNFGFDEVMSTILRRGTVLTDNRRLPAGTTVHSRRAARACRPS
jgi:hypothetical protein